MAVSSSPSLSTVASVPRAIVADRVSMHQDETLTGEAVALDVQPLGFFLRALGTLIDMIVALAVLVAGVFATVWLADSGSIPASAMRPVGLSLIVVVMVVLPTTVETLSRGRSLGRLAVGGRIVRVDGGSIGFRHALIRALVGVLELWLTLGAIAALVGIFTPRSQRLGDLLAGTACDRTRTRPLPAPAPGLPLGLETWAATADVSRLPDRIAARVSHFVRGADALEPAARVRVAAALADAVRPHVAPVPAVDPETFVRAVSAVRRSREYHALLVERERAAALVASA